ncbi:MAG: sulfur carrier protein ThiS [Hyphomicrobiales bacterium]|nr:sulfur carrier protein ThiS [Hyphomicrobiales bacterium]
MRIVVNGQSLETDAATLADLCADLGYGDAKIGTALNGAFVPASRRADTRLRADDRVEILAPRQGG